MLVSNTAEKFGSLTKFLHWTITVLFFAQFFLIYRRGYFPDNAPEKLQYILLHKSFGVTIFMLGILMITSHFIGTRPLMPLNMSRLEIFGAKFMHFLLYLSMLLMPISGFLMSSYAGYSVSWFGWKLPNPVLKDESLSHFFKQTHEVVAFTVIALISAHILAALYHHFVRKDNVLKRMI